MLPATLGVMIPIIALLIGPLIVFIIVWGENKKRALDHEERLRAIDKGYPLPMQQKKPKARYPFAWPFVFIGLGLALIIIYIVQAATDFRPDIEPLGFGLVFFFIGLGLFFSRYYGVKQEDREGFREEKEEYYMVQPGGSEAMKQSAAAEATTEPPQEKKDS